MVSYWEQSTVWDADVVVIGAGIVGLSTAAEILEEFPGLKLIVLERSALPYGASWRNAGFACFGSVSELLADQSVMGEDQMLELVKMRIEGLQKTRKRLGDEKIGFRQVGGYELLKATDQYLLDRMEGLNEALHDYFAIDVFRNADDLINQFGFDTQFVKHLIYNPLEGYLHAGLMMKQLTACVAERGGVIVNGAQVISIDDTSTPLLIIQIGEDLVKIKPKAVAVCTNAFTNELFKLEDLKPGRGLVLLSRPVELSFKGTFHIEEGYYYFRDLDGRLLIGGGRHLDFENEATLKPGINQMIKDRLIELAEQVIVPGQKFDWDMEWSGVMAFGKNKMPIIGLKSPHIALAVRMGGMGVAIAGKAGELVKKHLEPILRSL